MALSRTDETELLTALHEGPFGEPPWHVFLHRLLRRTGADHASLILQSTRAGAQEAMRFFAAPDPWPQAEDLAPSPLPCARLRPGRVYDLGEMVELSDSRCEGV